MSIKDRRNAQGWTQEQLAQHAGLSARTVQRLEQGQTATLETLKCLAAVLETDVKTLMDEQTMIPNDPTQHEQHFRLETREREALDYVENLKWLYLHALIAVAICLVLFALNAVVSPDIWWVVYVVLGWAVGLAAHAAYVYGNFDLFSPEWEHRQFRRRLDKRR